MVHSNTGINEVNWNPDGPKNAPDSWPAHLKYPPLPCHDATRPPEARGTCDIPLYKLEADCVHARGTWIPHHFWNPGEPECCGGFNYNGTEQERCVCGPGTNRSCGDCPHDCRVVIGRYPFDNVGPGYPVYLAPIFGCSTEEYCTRADDVYPWITNGCDCCGPCCPSMIGSRHIYEWEGTATLDIGNCYPIISHGQHGDQSSCEGATIDGVTGTWRTTDEDIVAPTTGQSGVCFKAGPELDLGQVLVPGGSRIMTDAQLEADCDSPDVWVPITRLNSSPPGCIPPNKCSDNCGGSQIGACEVDGDIVFNISKDECAGCVGVPGSPDQCEWVDDDKCVTQPPCCDKRGMQMYAKEGFETLKAQISGCSCPGGGICETDLTWLGGAGLPISISPWEKFGGIDPYKELLIAVEGSASPPGLGIVDDFVKLNTFNLEDTCGVWAGTFGTCPGCGHYVALYDVDCAGCGYTAHPLKGICDDETDWTPGHSPGVDQTPFNPQCIDFPAIQPTPICVHTFVELVGANQNCNKCCREAFGKPHGDCAGHCEDINGGTISAGDGFECAQAGGNWILDCDTGGQSGGGGGNPGIGGPGQGSGEQPPDDCGINCTNASGGYFQCDCADSAEKAARFGIPLCKTVVTECGNAQCSQYAFAAPGTCCDWWTVSEGGCDAQKIVNRGQRCGDGTMAKRCDCCEGCPSCIQDANGDMVDADSTFDRATGDFGDWCNIPEEGPGCSVDVASCGPNAICHPNIECNGTSPIDKGLGACCSCPDNCVNYQLDECPYQPCRDGNGELITSAQGNMPPPCYCGNDVNGLVWHPDHPPKPLYEGGAGDCKVFCNNQGAPYWAMQLCPNFDGTPPDEDPGDDPEQPGDGIPGDDPGGGGGGGVANECVGCGQLSPRLIQDCSFEGICGCGLSDWTGRCDNPCPPDTGSVQTVYLVCRQEGSCKEDCDDLGMSREWRGECHKNRCMAKRGGEICIGEGSQYWPPDPPHGGNDGIFRWANLDEGGDDPTWGDESECPCGPVDSSEALDCTCQGPTRGQIECMGATGRCQGGPHLEGVAVGGTLCQNHWQGTDRYACGHEWFTPPWGWPPVCGGGCGTHDFDFGTKFYGKLTENSSAGVCQWPGPNTPCSQGQPEENIIDRSSPFGNARDCMGDPERDGRCTCDPAQWPAYSTKTDCNNDGGKDWITYNWVETGGICWHKSGHRIFNDNGGDLILDATTCEAMGTCTDPNCQGAGCGLPACAGQWSTKWKEMNDPYWHDTEFAMANQEMAGPNNIYPKYITLLDYKYGGLGDSCYDGCMCGSADPSCEGGGGCPDMPNCLGACFSCDGNEWDITEAECRVKVAACAGRADSGGGTTGGGESGGEGTPGGYDPGGGDGGDSTGGNGAGSGGGRTGSGYDWKPNPFDPQGCFVPDEICKGCLSCDGNEADVCGGCDGKSCGGGAPQTPHCLSKQWCDGTPRIGDCGVDCASVGCTGGGCGNYNPWNWKHRRCGKTCNDFQLIIGGQVFQAGYQDGAIKHLTKPNCRLFAPDTCCPDTIYLEGKDRPAPFVRIAQIDIADYGEGYTIPPTVTIDDPTFVVLPDGITATSSAHIDKDITSADYGKLTEISVSNKGLGYADPNVAAPDPVTVQVSLSGGCSYINNGVPNPDHCGVCSAREHTTKTACNNNVGTCVDSNGNEIHEHTTRTACEDADDTNVWVPSVGTWTALRQGSATIRLEAWVGDCDRGAIVDKDQKFKDNAACGCIKFNDCTPGDPPDADKSHRYEDYICDDIIMTSWEELGQEVKTGNILHVWRGTNPNSRIHTLDGWVSYASSINGDYEIERISGASSSIKLKCSGRKVSAFQDECEAGYCENCKDGCPDGDNCPERFKDCCKTGKRGASRQRCLQPRILDDFDGLVGGCEGEWVGGTCDEVLPTCPSCDGREKCLYNGKCKDVNGDRNIHNGKCAADETYDAENCTDPNKTLAENIAECRDACFEHTGGCWIGAVGCLQECCGCEDCQDTAVGLRCPDCCWDVDAQGHLTPCDGGCSDQIYRTKVDCEANNEIWKEGTECPNDTHPNGPCPPRREDCCDANCPKDNIITEVDVGEMGLPVHPHTGYSVCANPNHPDFGGFNTGAGTPRGLPSCEKCTNTWGGDWDEFNGVCRNISTYKFKCGSYGHLDGGQDTDWEPGCCEEHDCVPDTCNPPIEQRGDCCGLWSTSACACPSNYKDCDGNITIDDVTGDPIRRPFILDLAIHGGAGGCCGNTANIVGVVPGTEVNVGGASQLSSRIIITEYT